jgi:hypothetical protein
MRRYVAVDTDSPTPVPIAAYAARHTGHFGTSARMAPGTIHREMSRQRRTSLGGCGSPSVVRDPAVSRSGLLEAPSQQQ